MTPDQELMLIFGGLHLVALAFGAVLLVMFLRSETADAWRPPDEDEGSDGGGNDRTPAIPRSPTSPGGLPLPDADPSPVRLRDHGRLADRYPADPRRREHPPHRAPRVPSPG